MDRIGNFAAFSSTGIVDFAFLYRRHAMGFIRREICRAGSDQIKKGASAHITMLHRQSFGLRPHI